MSSLKLPPYKGERKAKRLRSLRLVGVVVKICDGRPDNPLPLRGAPFVKGEYSRRTVAVPSGHAPEATDLAGRFELPERLAKRQRHQNHRQRVVVAQGQGRVGKK